MSIADSQTIARESPPPTPDSAATVGSAACHHMLKAGTRLGEFEILGLIGEGGFGIVYLAQDHTLQRRVAVKEYMPTSLATRDGNSSAVVIQSAQYEATFQAGLKSFINEARLLARFDHPALVKVYRYWEENGTTYMAMPYYEGPTLRAALADLKEPPAESWLRKLMEPLLDALDVLHGTNCFHRDIAPDNILLTRSGPLLLDFGAARRVIGDANHALTVVLKPGYAPIEQYGEVASMRQGPWTDLYALACVVYCAITRQSPIASIERLITDRMRPVSELAAGRYSKAFLGAIDAALAVKPEDRPRDVASFRALLGKPEASPARTSAKSRRNPESTHTGSADRVSMRWYAWAAVGTAVLALVVVAWTRLPHKQIMRQPAVASSTDQQAGAGSALVLAPVVAVTNPTESATMDGAMLPDASEPLATISRRPAKPARSQPGNESVLARCHEILQKASLETLATEEADYLRRECR